MMQERAKGDERVVDQAADYASALAWLRSPRSPR